MIDTTTVLLGYLRVEFGARKGEWLTIDTLRTLVEAKGLHVGEQLMRRGVAHFIARGEVEEAIRPTGQRGGVPRVYRYLGNPMAEELANLREENARLRAELASLKAELAEMAGLEANNAELDALRAELSMRKR